MSPLPPLNAPDGFELGVFARVMLSQLPVATALPSFEEAVLQKGIGASTPPTAATIRPLRQLIKQRGIGWKTTMASVVLLATLGSVTWFTGIWNSNGLGNDDSSLGNVETQIENADVQLRTLPALPNPPASTLIPTDMRVPTDMKRADPTTKIAIVKRGKSAINNATRVFAGH